MSISKWFHNKGDNADIVVSTRVRLARNLVGYPFASRMTPDQEAEVLTTCSDALLKNPVTGEEFTLIKANENDRVQLQALVEKHLISPEFAGSGRVRGLLLSRDEGISIMINEEDHLRLQVLGSGLCLDTCLDTARHFDALFEESLCYAYDEKLGYLTHCPTNLGTGLRASVMLHLPVLTESGSIGSIIAAAGKLGLAVRGLYGEGSTAQGSLYQISNQYTLGFTEVEIISRIKDTVSRIITDERMMREHAARVVSIMVSDRVSRAEGLLSHARMMSSEEAMSLLSDLRFGVSMGYTSVAGIEVLNSLLWEIQPACLIQKRGQSLSAPERDICRADILREALNKGK